MGIRTISIWHFNKKTIPELQGMKLSYTIKTILNNDLFFVVFSVQSKPNFIPISFGANWLGNYKLFLYSVIA